MSSDEGPAGRIARRLRKPWMTGQDRFEVAVTGAITTALWLAVVPSEENRIPERSPEDFDSSDE